jgi:hypothetical protein
MDGNGEARNRCPVRHMPAAVPLKFTSMSWTSDGRLVILQTDRPKLVAVWRPGQKRIAIRRLRMSISNVGSDTFVPW